jgi:hypothetical protein
MSSWGQDDSEEAGNQEDEEDDLYKSVNDHLIFLIDARRNMFKSNKQGEVTICFAQSSQC